jgi:hypothetical protein
VSPHKLSIALGEFTQTTDDEEDRAGLAILPHWVRFLIERRELEPELAAPLLVLADRLEHDFEEVLDARTEVDRMPVGESEGFLG